MPHPYPQQPHLGQNSPWQPPYPEGGVAPLRADVALACYLEKRAAFARPKLWDAASWGFLTRLFRRKPRPAGQMIQVRAALR